MYLNVNGIQGPTRHCSEFGLPQASVMSPIPFEIFMLDFREDLNVNSTTIYKWERVHIRVALNKRTAKSAGLPEILQMLFKGSFVEQFCSTPCQWDEEGYVMTSLRLHTKLKKKPRI